MGKTVFESIGTLHAGTYEDIEVEGVVKIDGDIVFRDMEIDGVCNGSGAMSGKKLEVNGVCKVQGDIRVDHFIVDGLMSTYDGKIYANQIEIAGQLTNHGEVSADRVVIDGIIHLNELVGDVIEVNAARSIKSFHLGNLFKKENSGCQIQMIECTRLYASDTACKKISAREIVLENGCVVEEIDCDGSLTYDHTCKIKKINGDCEIHVA